VLRVVGSVATPRKRRHRRNVIAAHIPPAPLGTARIEPFNLLGFWTLYLKEVRRFLKVSAQTVTGPAVTTLLFLVVFDVALSGRRPAIDGVPFIEFLAPGLIMMAMAQNAFANSASSLLISKMQGTISDLLMAPLGPVELVAGFALGAVTRGLAVGLAATTAMLPFASLAVAHPGLALYHVLAANLMLALLGVLAGLWAEKMDQLGAVTSFIVTPLTFLSGTFYSVADLPEVFRLVALLNPVFYMVDGFRYALTGHADGAVGVGAAVMAAVDALLALLCWQAFASGCRLKP
jgi:ABC-2 type transport system permease protein